MQRLWRVMMLWLLTLVGCLTDTWTPPAYPAVVPGPPVVGAAEGWLKLPVGTPLGGYTARCTCLGGGFIDVDDRQSAYNTAFIESTGIQTLPSIKVIWLENGDDHLVLTKTDSIYSFDGLVDALEDVLEERTGENLQGKVVHTTNHSHSSWGTFSHAITFYLGSDKYNEENFQRFLGQIADVAVDAYEQRAPARIGMGWEKDWDPDDRVYSDRRGINNELRPWGEDSPDWTGQKDPFLGMVRFDTLEQEPIAVIANFGIHGILGDADSPMVSSDSAGHIEQRMQEAFEDEVIVMFTQGSGGDQSPRGVQDDFARMESVGELAVEPMMQLWSEIETSADVIRLETASRSIPQHPSQIRVTRGGEVDWEYLPYDPDYRSDDEVYDEDGEILSPLDEFNSRVGHVFCGTGDLDFPVGKLESNVLPYSNCMDVDLLGSLIETFFLLEDGIPLPLPESLRAGTTATRLGPIPVRTADGDQMQDELLIGFLPGEATSMYTEQWKRRASAEHGHTNAMMVSYSQDHEGYLLIPEDWLLGEYEADIVVWGPLQGEHVLEGALTMVGEVLWSDVHEDPDPLGIYQRTTYPTEALPTHQPDPTPNAGTVLVDVPETLWTPLEIAPDLVIPAQVPRGQHVVQLAWSGGDPGIDSPQVTIEHLDGADWVPLETPSGRLIDEGRHDILLAHTPDPLAPFTADQEHFWWAAWQTVSHSEDRTGLPLGTYRMKVSGTRYTGGSTTWPWAGEPYELTSAEFEVVPGALDLTWDGTTLTAALIAPSNGFRLIHLEGDQRGENPIEGPVQITIQTPPLDELLYFEDPVTVGNRSVLEVQPPPGAVSIQVTDAHGNTATVFL